MELSRTVIEAINSPEKMIMESGEYNSRSQQLTVDSLFELLIRLPINTLLLKCIFVSKLWCSIIRSSLFANVYGRRNPYRLVLNAERSDVPEAFYSYPLRHPFEASPEQSVHLFNLPLPLREENYCVTGIVNGLVCYYSREGLFLANIFTQETMPLPHKKESLEYYLGFDPVHKVYKLLAKRLFLDVKFEILTLSKGSSWRDLDLGYNSDITGGYLQESMFINGVLYWINKAYYYSSKLHVEIYSFNFTKEKFEAVTKPKPVILGKESYGGPERPVMYGGLERPSLGLVQFKGQLCLSMFTTDKIRLCVLEEDGQHCTSTSIIEAASPPEHRFAQSLRIFLGNMPNGKVFYISNDKLLYIYVYKNDQEGFVRETVGELPDQEVLYFRISFMGRYRDSNDKYFACVEQNIISLDTLFQGD